MFLVFSDPGGGNATKECDSVWTRIVCYVWYSVCFKTVSYEVNLMRNLE
jgi:hypothetical protein